MYGMIHRAVRQMVLDRAGQETWDQIEAIAGTGQSELISAEIYDDAVTLQLIGSAARCVEIDVGEFLVDFGRYWIAYAESGPFGPILNFTGDDIATFLRNLDRLHDGVQTVMPNARMPSFKVVSEEPDVLLVDYHSERTGLEPFVEGLLLGLLDRFNLSGAIDIVPSAEKAVRFRIAFQPRADG